MRDEIRLLEILSSKFVLLTSVDVESACLAHKSALGDKRRSAALANLGTVL